MRWNLLSIAHETFSALRVMVFAPSTSLISRRHKHIDDKVLGLVFTHRHDDGSYAHQGLVLYQMEDRRIGSGIPFDLLHLLPSLSL